MSSKYPAKLKKNFVYTQPNQVSDKETIYEFWPNPINCVCILYFWGSAAPNILMGGGARICPHQICDTVLITSTSMQNGV